ncbi:MAG: UDP-glucose 4-epimerase GalE [Desulfobacterales bacterium]|jgi:UDP-glucose-4-epimerase GalE|nr:UDP-glucose 4-epimerase GalE [Desulfobacterales bacterium]MDP6808682.1 UDP-glucose 4-epimerase GalE [Desulfobacterales bacterium]|tara:strand:+ start:7107 stop:8096 length:990 start_codon:yes stop_codon:yes gene_type:complete
MNNILVVGGAGYIGSYMCKYLAKNGYHPVILDNLIYGHREAVKWGSFFKGSMDDSVLLDQIFSEHQIAAVMHFAAFCYVGESVLQPARYYRNNVANTLNLLEFMNKRGVRSFIFSSSCATYGEPVEIPITENHTQNPINPYGRSKLMVEQIMEDFSHAYKSECVSLRYFNAAGADPDGELGEDHNPETHLIPLVLKTAIGKREMVNIFGDDYPTKDGTCIRDYIHIDDLAQAHLLALERLLSGLPGGCFNLGNGSGHSVMQLIETARKVTGKTIPSKVVDRRPGDPAVLIGSSEKAIKTLGWHPRFPELETIIETAWKWHKNHPNGYGS